MVEEVKDVKSIADKKKSEEVFVEPAKMTREGDLEFGFSEELHVPGFIKGEADD